MITLRGHHLLIFSHYVRDQDAGVPLERRDRLVLQSAAADHRPRAHGPSIVRTMRYLLEHPEELVRLTDTIDTCCASCHKRTNKECREFIPYDASAASEDRAHLHHYGLRQRVYKAGTIADRVRRIAPF